jgi:NADH dehydrogenase [ubiquinone] 1 alpha subcomplex assembly factor 1
VISLQDLPSNQPTLLEKIKRDEWHMFYQEDEKHGYWKRKPVTLMQQMNTDHKNPKKALQASFQVIKGEVAKFSEEVKDGEYNVQKTIREGFVVDGQRRKEWGFQSEVEMDQWILTKDADWGEGYSSADFKLNDAGSAGILSGNLSTRVPNDGRTDNAGYVNIASVNQRRSFGRLKLLNYWAHYTHLTMYVRGDGRKYMINLKVHREYDMTWDDRWMFPLYTRGGPYWQYVKIPFSKFIFGHKGSIQDRQNAVMLEDMQSISFTLKDKITGPFQLEMKDISLHNDPTFDDEKFAYEMYLVPQFWIGAG